LPNKISRWTNPSAVAVEYGKILCDSAVIVRTINGNCRTMVHKTTADADDDKPKSALPTGYRKLQQHTKTFHSTIIIHFGNVWLFDREIRNATERAPYV
jgi:hypothetical protein